MDSPCSKVAAKVSGELREVRKLLSELLSRCIPDLGVPVKHHLPCGWGIATTSLFLRKFRGTQFPEVLAQLIHHTLLQLHVCAVRPADINVRVAWCFNLMEEPSESRRDVLVGQICGVEKTPCQDRSLCASVVHLSYPFPAGVLSNESEKKG